TARIGDDDTFHTGCQRVLDQSVQRVYQFVPEADVATKNDVLFGEKLRFQIFEAADLFAYVDVVQFGVQVQQRKHELVRIGGCDLGLEFFHAINTEGAPAAAD